METIMFDIDFDSHEPQFIVHSQYESIVPKIKEGLEDFDLSDHFILFSSGTTGGDLKGYALSKKALFENAKATNDHFGLNSHDVWGLSLPLYHVGGLSVLARAYQLKNKVVDLRKWDPLTWRDQLKETTITTIVPTQLYDLVHRKIQAPKSLKKVIVGGDFLSTELEKRAIDLGWNVLRTFGMTEVCSQLASVRMVGSKELEILPIHQVKTTEDQTLWIKSPSLFTLQFIYSKTLMVIPSADLCDEDGFYQTSDRAEIWGNVLKHLGRKGDEVKISGHLVNLIELRNELSRFLLLKDAYQKMEFILEQDDRKGHKLVLLSTRNYLHLVEEVSKIIYPIKIDELREVDQFERTGLGKLRKT